MGIYTWGIGIVVSLIAAAYVWRGLRVNSSTTQAAVAIVVTPLIVLITTTVIVLVGSTLTATIALTDSQVTLDKIVPPQGSNDYTYLIGASPTVIVGLLASVVVGLLLAFAAGYAVQRIIELKVLRNQTKEPDETEEDT
jgi:hypothetical protein